MICIFVLLTIGARADGASQCPNPVLPHSLLSDLGAYQDALVEFLTINERELQAGDEKQCSGATGIFQSISSDGKKETLRFAPLSQELRNHIGDSEFDQVYLVNKLKPQQSTPSGLLVQKKDGQWALLERTIPARISAQYPYDTEQRGVVYRNLLDLAKKPLRDLVLDFQNCGANGKMLNEAGLKVTTLEFDRQMTSAVASNGAKLSYDGLQSVDDYLTAKRRKENPNLLTDLMGPSPVRIPPEMYELLSTPEFGVAHGEKRYSQIMDMIWKKSLEVAKGDRFKATYIALITSDMRQRGVCGAVFGLRGRQLVPPSIFDGEKPSPIEPNRLDAPQHFFGYALLRQVTSDVVAKTVSAISKEKDYYLPRALNYTEDFHIGGGDVANPDGYKGSRELMGLSAGFQKQRRRIDIDRDKFYNELGIQFGESPEALPSQILNGPRAERKKPALGLGKSNEGSWKAWDPQQESPFFATDDDRSKWRLFQNDFPEPADEEQSFEINQKICRFGVSQFERRQACKSATKQAEKFVRGLYKNRPIQKE